MSVPSFLYRAVPAYVVFGQGTLVRVPSILDELGGMRAMLLSTSGRPGLTDRLAGLLGDRLVARFDGAAMHTPVNVTEGAMAALRDANPDFLVGIGGGSATGLSKALALRTGLRQLIVPTTYAGSEMTPILGETVDGCKTTQRASVIRPEAVIYDVDLTLGLPAPASGNSGLNAVAHAVEGLYAQDTNPIMQSFAMQGIAALAAALPIIAHNPDDVSARSEALYGAWLCGTVLGSTSMGLHHKLCHVLGGRLELPHAETHSIILPYVVAYNAEAAPEAMAMLAQALGVHSDPAGALWNLGRTVGAPHGLRGLGMSRDQIAGVVNEVLGDAYQNPRLPEPESIFRLLSAAWAGDCPRTKQ